MAFPQQNPNLIPDKEKQPSKNGTGFVNLQKYLGANQGNKLGSAVAGNVQGVGQQAKQNLTGQQQQFGQGVAQARAGIGQAQQNVAGTFQKLDAPQFGGIGGQDVEQFKNLRDQAYTGPVGLQNAQQLQQQAANAASLGKLAGSREGRQELLRETIHAPVYTAAQQRLDELLMSLGGGAGQVRKAGQAVRQTPEEIARGIQAAQSEGLGTQRQYQGLQQEAAQGINTRNAALDKILNEQYGTAQQKEQKRQADLAAYKQAVAAGNAGAAPEGLFDPAMAEDIRRLSGAGSEFANVVASHINPGSVDLNSRGQSASEMQRQQVNALAKLAGQKGEFEGFSPKAAEAAKLSGLSNVDDRGGYNTLGHSLNTKYGYNPEQYNTIAAALPDLRNAAHNDITNYIKDAIKQPIDKLPEHFKDVAAGKIRPEDAASQIIAGQRGGGDPFPGNQKLLGLLNNLKNEESKFASSRSQMEQATAEQAALADLLNKYR